MSKQSPNHRPRKRFGQNFLRDPGVIDHIASTIGARASDHLVEIGPGQGALTESLVDSDCRLDVVELDRDLVPGLLAAFSIHPNFKLHSADALQFDFASLLEGEERLRIVGNLPYNISTPLIFKLLENTKTCSILPFRPPEAFDPAPKVQSAIVRLAPRQNSPWPACDEESLRSVVQSAFAQRRKTLRNNLKGIINDERLLELDINPSARAETLTLEQFIRITNACNSGS